MSWKQVICILLGLGAVVGANPLSAETRVSGQVSGLWERRASPFVVTADISLRNNDTLRIEPGVIVQFQGNFRFTVNGRLMAEGTPRDTIFFYGGGQPGSWRGIFFTGAGADRGRLSYCGIRFAYQGINLDDADPTIDYSSIVLCADAGISFNRSLSRVTACRISRINGSGLKIGGSSRAIVRACSISVCQDNGIVVNESANPVLDHNYIENVSDHGIALSGAAPCSVVFNKIISTGARGLSISESNGAIIMRNVVDGSTGPGAFLYRSAGVEFVNNTIQNSGAHGVQVSTNVSGYVENSIIENSDLSGLIVQGSNPTCDYNNLYNNRDGDYNGIAAGGHDRHIPSGLDENYNPRQGNALIDAGDPFQPPDPDGTTADIGAGFFNQNRPPEIRSVIPDWPQDTTVRGDAAYDFSAEVVDPDNHFLTWKWFVNDIEEWRNVTFRRNFNRDGDYTVRLLVDDRYYLGQADYYWHFFVEGSAVPPEASLPEGYALSQAYPNPFNSTFRMNITLPIDSRIRLDLLDGNGRYIRAIGSGEFRAGESTISFDAGDLPSGDYLIDATINGHKTIRRSVLLR